LITTEKKKDMKMITTYDFYSFIFQIVKLSSKLFVHEHDKPENNYQNIEGKTNNNYTFETVPCQFVKINTCTICCYESVVCNTRHIV
jgi:hypothetical protein